MTTQSLRESFISAQTRDSFVEHDRGVKGNGVSKTTDAEKKNPGSEGGRPGVGALRGTTGPTNFFWTSFLKAELVVQVPQEHRRPENDLHS